ncbi:MAG: hypothetical protein JWN36_2786 [Microbacteriaceae bacterium]|nr:hypothetical protein [Microbacteriaceae bacterium]
MTYDPPAAPPTGQPVGGDAPAGVVPIWAPYYGAPLKVAVVRFFTKYADFTGRASRSEYWWWALVYFVVANVLEIASFAIVTPIMMQLNAIATGRPAADVGLPAGTVTIGIVLLVISLGLLVPQLALTWRRLHDTNRSGGFFFLGLIPWVGAIILVVFLALGPDPAGARFDRPR